MNTPTTKITGPEVQAAVKAKGITYIPSHECSICGVEVGFRTDGERLAFYPGCGCYDSGRGEPRSWDGVADWINVQDNPTARTEVAAKFGLTL